jgi:hypothetical protein
MFGSSRAENGISWRIKRRGYLEGLASGKRIRLIVVVRWPSGGKNVFHPLRDDAE